MSALSRVHVYYLIVRCLQIDTPEGGGRTPLMYAAARSPLEMITLLLEAGAAVTVWDQRGRTAYHHAIRARNGPALRALLRYWPRPLFAEWRHHRRAHRARLKQQATSAAAVAAAGGSGGHTRDVSAAVSVVRPMALSSADRIHDAQQLLGITATPSGAVAAAAAAAAAGGDAGGTGAGGADLDVKHVDQGVSTDGGAVGTTAHGDASHPADITAASTNAGRRPPDLSIHVDDEAGNILDTAPGPVLQSPGPMISAVQPPEHRVPRPSTVITPPPRYSELHPYMFPLESASTFTRARVLDKQVWLSIGECVVWLCLAQHCIALTSPLKLCIPYHRQWRRPSKTPLAPPTTS